MVLAQDEARGLKHNYIGTEHILLGLLREEEGLAARVLTSLDVTVEKVRAQIRRIIGEGDVVITGQIPFTPRAKKVCELALREALSLGHNYIGTEHLLLGLLREEEGVAALILRDFDANAEKIRNEIIRFISIRPSAAPKRTSRIFKRVDYAKLASPGETTVCFRAGPERFIVEGKPNCDDFLLATDAWRNLGEPVRIRVTVEAVK